MLARALGCFGLAVRVLAVGVLLTAAAPADAQTVAAAPQILTLDQDRLYADSLYGKALEAKAATASQALAAENRRIEADLAAEEADLTQKRATLTPQAFQTLADAFDAKVESVRAAQAAKSDALKAEHDAGRTTFFKAAIPVLADLMRKTGAYAILNHDAVVLSFDAIDVTDRAIKALDASLGDGSKTGSGPRIGTSPAPDQTQGATPGQGQPGATKPTSP